MESSLEEAFVQKRICLMALLGSLVFVGCGSGQSTNDLIEDLKSSEEGDRIKAVRLVQLRKGDASKVVPALIESLQDQQADIRWSAAIGLGHFGAEAESGLTALEKAQRDPDARVREAARVAISRIGH
ncbi:MAG: hypothetical protein JWM11_5916 [Planctomycetaceae bacterium]|nr:hypothetical protein [Planctomycetaceae bacterium]